MKSLRKADGSWPLTTHLLRQPDTGTGPQIRNAQNSGSGRVLAGHCRVSERGSESTFQSSQTLESFPQLRSPVGASMPFLHGPSCTVELHRCVKQATCCVAGLLGSGAVRGLSTAKLPCGLGAYAGPKLQTS